MNALILDGTCDGDSIGQTAGRVLAERLDPLNWQAESIVLRDIDIAACTGCFGCWDRTPGLCVIDDPAREIARKFVRSDLTVFLTPVTFGGYSRHLKKALDRMISSVSPMFTKIHGTSRHKTRYDRYPRLLGLGVLVDGDDEAEQIFRKLVRANAANMHSPQHAAALVGETDAEDTIRHTVDALLHQVGLAP